MQLKNISSPDKTTILAVDDNNTSLRLLEMMLIQDGNCNVLTAVNGKEALAVLQADPEKIDIILLDRIMPEMDGIELCHILKKDESLRTIPVIMQTAAGRPQDIKEGIDAGVFYYLVKPLVAKTLLSIVTSAKKKVKRYRLRTSELLQHKESMAMVQSLKCTYRTLEEAETLAAFLAGFFPHPDQVLTGVSELLINAVEHGNLGISFREKTELLLTNSWTDEVARRLADPCYKERVVTVSFEKGPESCSLSIHDEGLGFDWKKYLEVDTTWATHNHGRGIAMARLLSFDKLQYNDRGNQVTAISFG